MPSFYLLAVLILSSTRSIQADRSPQSYATLGVVVEDRTLDPAHLAASFNRARQLTNRAVAYKLIQFGSIDTYRVIQAMCDAMHEHTIGFFVTATSCPTHAAIVAFAHEKKITHVALDADRCPEPKPYSAFYEYTFSFYLNTTESVDSIVGEMVHMEQWPSVVLLYDETFSHRRALKVKQSIEAFSPSARVHELKLFLASQSRRSSSSFGSGGGGGDLLTSRFNDVIRDGEFFNFVLLATKNNTRAILNMAENRQVNGKTYNWIIANQELQTSDLVVAKNQTRVLLISRRRPESRVLVQATQLPPNIIRPDFVPHGSEYIEDAIGVFMRAIKRTDAINWAQLKDVRCWDTSGQGSSFATGDKLRDATSLVGDFNATTGVISFDRRASRKFVDQISLDLHRSSAVDQSEEPLTWQPIGSKMYNEPLNLTTEKPFEIGLKILADATLKIVTIEEHPFVMKRVSEDGKVYYEGCCIDILKAIQKDLDEDSFKYEIYEVEDNQYGGMDKETGRWTGLVGDVLYKKADMAVAGMIRNYDRELVVDFTASFMDYGVSILIPRPKKTTSIFGFLEPLTVQVWICISVATFAVGLMLFILSRLSPFSRFNMLGTDEFSFNNSMWFALASLMQQGGDATPLSISGRILGTFWWFFTLIIIATYTANLAAFLTVTRMETPIESLDDLAGQSKLPYGTVSPSSLADFFKTQAKVDALYERIWNYMDTADPSPMVEDEEEGFARVLQGNYAFLWDDPVLQYQRKLHCKHLTTVGKPFNRKNYAFAVPKGAAYWETITLSILRLQESGELDKIKQKWFEGEQTCSDDDSIGGGKEAEGIAIKNVAGVFYILGMGAGLSFFTALIELVWHKYLRTGGRGEEK